MEKVKIDVKIKTIRDWLNSYPTLVVGNGCNVVYYPDNCDEETKKRIDEEIVIMKTYYDYFRVRKSSGKLSNEILTQIKDLNLGGVLGYSDELEKLRKEYGVSPCKLMYIIKNNGSIENLYDKYRNGEQLKDIEEDVIEYISRSSYAIDKNDEYSKNYDRIVISLSKASSAYPVLYSRNVLEDVINELSEYQSIIIKERYGLLDGKPKDLARIGSIMNVSRERVRQIEAKAIRRLCNSKKLSKIYFENYKMIDLLRLTEEEKVEFIKAERTLFISRDEEELKKATEVIKKHVLDDDGNFITPLSAKYVGTNVNVAIYSTKIDELELSTRAYNGLKRAGIVTIGDLIEYGDLKNTHYLGKISISEINAKLDCFLGTELSNKDETTIEIKNEEEKSETKSEDIEILRTENEELERKLKEQEEKEKLLDEYIEEAKKNEELKSKLAKKEEEIKKKEEFLRSRGIKHEKK